MAPPPAPALSPIAAAVDELGDLEKLLAPFKLQIARAEQLRRIVRSAFEDSPAEEEIKATGSRFVAVLGPRGNETRIDFPELIAAIKPERFALFATCTLKSLRDNAPAELVARVTSVGNTGPRSLAVHAKA